MECLNVVTSNKFSKYNERCTKKSQEIFFRIHSPPFLLSSPSNKIPPPKNIALDSHNQHKFRRVQTSEDEGITKINPSEILWHHKQQARQILH